jgi:hypothetical protein
VQLAKAVGPPFEAHFRKMLEPLMGLSQPHRAAVHRSLAFGCCGDVAQELGPSVAPHLSTLLPWSIAALADDEVSISRPPSLTSFPLFFFGSVHVSVVRLLAFVCTHVFFCGFFFLE